MPPDRIEMDRIPLSRLEKAARSGRRSKLFLGMYQHYEELNRILERAGRPNWKVLAEEFTRLGLVDINGNPPSRTVAKNTWSKVRALIAKEGVPLPRNPVEKPAPFSPANPVVKTAPEKPAQVRDDPMADIYRQWDERGRRMPEPLNKGKS